MAPPDPSLGPPSRRRWRREGWAALALALLVAMAFFQETDRPVVEREERPSAVQLSPVSPASAAPVALPSTGNWEAADKAISEALVDAVRQSRGLGLKRLNNLVNVLNDRVGTTFVPWYLSFGRRKLEELGAYNAYALDWIHGVVTGEFQDTGTPALMATFEQQFVEQVLKPEETRHALMEVGREVALDFGNRMSHALQRIQEEKNIPFARWNRHLEEMPPLVFTAVDGSPMTLPVTALTGPDRGWHDLGAAVGGALGQRFDRLPSIVEPAKLVASSGESIFAVGQHVGLYFGSYLAYWIVLLILVRTGVIPINLFGALVGWLLWEIFAWGSWIGLESLDFDKTRAVLEPVIFDHADAYFRHVRTLLTETSAAGPFKALLQLVPHLPGP